MLPLEHFSQLHLLLQAAESDPDAWKSLELALEQSKSQFCRLLSFPGPDSTEKQQIEKGVFRPLDGGVLNISNDFKNETLFLSQQLELSEFLTASLMLAAERSGTGARAVAEVALRIYYDMRQDLLRALVSLITLSQKSPDTARSQKLHLYIQQLAQEWDVLKQIDQLQSLASKQQSQAQVQVSQNASFNQDVLAYRQAQSERESRDLAMVLCLLASFGYLTTEKLVNILQWLQTAPITNPITPHIIVVALAAMNPLDLARTFTPQEVTKIYDAISNKEYKDPQIQAILLLQWSLFFRSMWHYDPTLEQQTNLTEEVAEENVYKSLQHDALPLLLSSIVNCSHFSAEFNALATSQLETLVEAAITLMQNPLKKLRHKEEDSRMGLRRHTSNAAEPRKDVTLFFNVVQAVYGGRPEAALKYWIEDQNLNLFIHWASQSSGAMANAFVAMLAAMSTGEKSATCAFEFLNSNNATGTGTNGGISWQHILGAFQHYAHHMSQMQHGQEIAESEIEVLISYAHLASTILRYSSIARAATFDNPLYKTPLCLFGLARHPLPPELKAGIFDMIGAFCCTSPDGSDAAFAAELSSKTWLYIEQCQLIYATGPADQHSIGSVHSSQGIVPQQLEKVETLRESYPATIAFLRLLTGLLHGQPTDLDSKLVHPSIMTIPENLGAPTRSPVGVWPYVAFVLNDCLLQLHVRKFKAESERWQMTEAIFEFLAKSLDTMDLEIFLTKPSIMATRQVMNQPGFEILARILTDTRVLQTVLATAQVPLPQLMDRSCAPSIVRTVATCLQILVRVLEIGPLFVDVVLPLVHKQDSRTLPFISATLLRSVPLPDQALLSLEGSGQAVAKLAALINCDVASRIPLLVVRLVTLLAKSRGFSAIDSWSVASLQTGNINRLVGYIDASEESERISNGFSLQLQGIYTQDDTERPLQLAILDLLLLQTEANATFPNIAHYLLGYSYQTGKRSIDASLDLTSGRTVLQTLAALGDLQSLPAEVLDRVLKLFYQLCSHKYTANSTFRYFRSQDNLLLKLASQLPLAIDGPASTMPSKGSEDKQSLAASPELVTQTCVFSAQAWLLKLVALEINELVNEQQGDRINALLVAIFSNRSNDPETAQFEQQSLSCMLELLHNLTSSGIQPFKNLAIPVDTPFSLLPYHSTIVRTSTILLQYDIDAVLQLIHTKASEIQSQGALKTVEQQQDALATIRTILKAIIDENAKASVDAAILQLLTSWSQVLDIVLVKAVSYLIPEDRVPLLLDLFETIVNLIDAASFSNDKIEVLCSAAVMLMNCMREEQLSGPSAILGSSERLSSIFKLAVRTLMVPGHSLLSRGHMYAAVALFIRIVTSIPDDQKTSSRMALILASDINRLVALACRDALFGEDVWQIMCFTFLESTCALVNTCSPPSKILTAFAKHNFIHNVVQSLKTSQSEILSALAPDPESLNALYLFEAQVSFLTRIGSSPEGAEELHNAQLLTTLSQCDYVSMVRNETFESAGDDVFLPSTEARHRQLLLPILQLLVVFSARFACHHSNSLRELLGFLQSRQSMFINALQASLGDSSALGIELCALTLQLMHVVYPLVSPEELSSTASFGQLHSTVLAVAGSLLESPISIHLDQDQGHHSKVSHNGHDLPTKQLVRDTFRALFEYLHTACASQLSIFQPVLAADLSRNYGQKISIGTCLTFLRRQAFALTSHLQPFSDRQGSETAQKRVRIERDDLIADIQLVELVLLVLLPHARYYFSSSSQQRLVSSARTHETAKTAFQHEFGPVALRLQDIDWSDADADLRVHQSMIQQLLRDIANAAL